MISLSNARVLILAAGRGGRLMPFTANRPKCLVYIGNYPILHYQLQALQAYGIKDVIFVVGYRGEKIKNFVRKNFPAIKATFITNQLYATTNDIYSLYLARNYFDVSLLIMDSDVLFHPDIIKKIAGSRKKNFLCLKRVKCGKEEMKISLRGGKVNKISKRIKPEETAGELSGLSYFSKDFLSELQVILKKIIARGGVRWYREVAIEKVIHEKGVSLSYIDITKHPNIEIDFKEDLEIAERKYLPSILKALNSFKQRPRTRTQE